MDAGAGNGTHAEGKLVLCEVCNQPSRAMPNGAWKMLSLSVDYSSRKHASCTLWPKCTDRRRRANPAWASAIVFVR